MTNAGDRILLVENDPDITDLIARQTLAPVGYAVEVAADSSSAIRQALLASPDLILADLNLPGLSAKDLLVALSAQGIYTPLLVIANKGQEQEIIQAFRLGAADYLVWPARDAEVLSVVERALGRVHDARDRQQLEQKLTEANQELQRRTQELMTIINSSRAVISTPDQRALFQKLVESALQISNADLLWLLIRDDISKEFLLAAHHGLPEGWAKKVNKPLDDGLSGLVALSGETLAIEGEPLSKFKVAALGKSACVVPIKIQNEVIGMFVAVRTAERPFSEREQILLEVISGSVSISLVNARLFHALNTSIQGAKAGEKRQNTLLESFRTSVTEELRAAVYPIELLLNGKAGNLTDIQRQALQSTRLALQRLVRATEKTTPSSPITLKKK